MALRLTLFILSFGVITQSRVVERHLDDGVSPPSVTYDFGREASIAVLPDHGDAYATGPDYSAKVDDYHGGTKYDSTPADYAKGEPYRNPKPGYYGKSDPYHEKLGPYPEKADPYHGDSRPYYGDSRPRPEKTDPYHYDSRPYHGKTHPGQPGYKQPHYEADKGYETPYGSPYGSYNKAPYGSRFGSSYKSPKYSGRQRYYQRRHGHNLRYDQHGQPGIAPGPLPPTRYQYVRFKSLYDTNKSKQRRSSCYAPTPRRQLEMIDTTETCPDPSGSYVTFQGGWCWDRDDAFYCASTENKFQSQDACIEACMPRCEAFKQDATNCKSRGYKMKIGYTVDETRFRCTQIKYYHGCPGKGHLFQNYFDCKRECQEEYEEA